MKTALKPEYVSKYFFHDLQERFEISNNFKKKSDFSVTKNFNAGTNNFNAGTNNSRLLKYVCTFFNIMHKRD